MPSLYMSTSLMASSSLTVVSQEPSASGKIGFVMISSLTSSRYFGPECCMWSPARLNWFCSGFLHGSAYTLLRLFAFEVFAHFR
ncbi:unnamed protein product [Moneuplotes crassus]|uniref:Uncharacterized protein n=1 Tax=Euplotes crassus TaxID=5936 RepID=A0AAD1U8H2_EUPCR|nr:unnamed protein product [Moneuplotes crassus]